MRRLLWYWIISAGALLLAVLALRPNVDITPLWQVIWLAPLLGLVNVLVGGVTSIISLIAFPVNLLTLGCFGFVLSFLGNVLVIYYLGTAHRLAAFHVKSFLWAAALAILMALFSAVLNMLLPGKETRRR